MQFTDSHCHLDDIAFSDNLPQLLAQCQQLTVNRIIVPSISPQNFNNVLNLAKRYHTPNIDKPMNIYPCLGIHPWFLHGLNNNHLEQLSALVAKSKSEIIAIGEIGLDGAIAKNAEAYGQTIEENWVHQQHFFDYQLNLAKQQNLPVIVHHRQSHDKIMLLLKRYKLEKAGVIHGFTGSYQQATGYIDLGFKLGVGSTITYSRAKKTINTIKLLPLSSLVLETDAPSMPLSNEIVTDDNLDTENNFIINSPVNKPVKYPINSPQNIVKIFNVLTQIRTESPAVIAKQLEQNIDRLFFT